MSDDVAVTMELRQGYAFTVDLADGEAPPWVMDEPPPLGTGAGPSPSRLLVAAVANCLSSSALFCLRKARIDVRGMRTRAHATTARNESGRLRIAAITVVVQPVVAEEDVSRIARCLELFEDFCVVSQSVRAGIDISVSVDTVGEP
jgi:organic hydroperoxide reductase OsmC/OhrA